jgi:ParB/RepB/Spo0J family partition protein
MDVEIDKIDEPKAIIRMDIDQEEIEDLAVSISEIGLLQPILISVNNDRYETVFGHRRLLAHKHLGLAKIKSIVKQMSQKEIGIARATENIARADLTPIEEAATYKNLIEEYGMKIEHVAKKMGKRPATIKRRMDLLRMPPALQKAVHSKDITMTVAEELWAIRDQTQLEYYLIFAVENGATKEVARGWAQDWKDTVRRESSPGVEGGRVPLSPFEPRPIFVACDICVQPVELGKDKLMRLCPNCFKTIKEGMEVKK